MLKDSDIRTQVEYYLSDSNLSRDPFFNSKIREDPQGFIDLQFILNCNKIKSMGVSKEAIATAVKDSTEVELEASGTRIRRKGNKPLPEVAAKNGQKKLKIEPTVSIGKRTDGPGAVADAETHAAKANEDEEDDGEDNAKGDFIPLILFIKETSHLDKVIGKEFEKELSDHLGVEVAFARIGKYDGNVVINRDLVTQEIADKLLDKGFEYQGQKVVFEVGTDKDKKEFMRNHGRHIGKIILKSKFVVDTEYNKRLGNPISEAKKKYRGKVEFLGINYPTVESLKAVFKALIVKTKNDAVIDETGKAQVRKALSSCWSCSSTTREVRRNLRMLKHSLSPSTLSLSKPDAFS